MNQFLKKFLAHSVVMTVVITGIAHASETLGTIDSTNRFASFVRAPGATGSEVINFGNFTTQSAYNISISDAGIRGYAWGADAGWIVMNCLDTTSGCTANNESFKVAVSETGVLSGYAWGQKTGWINFGPFANSGTPQVQIAADGTFKGSAGDAGYAWSQKYGWIVFDCTDDACVRTDYVPSASRGSAETPQQEGNRVIGGSYAAPGVVVTPPTEPTTPVQPTVPAPTTPSTQPSTPPSMNGNGGSNGVITVTTPPVSSDTPTTSPQTTIPTAVDEQKVSPNSILDTLWETIQYIIAQIVLFLGKIIAWIRTFILGL